VPAITNVGRRGGSGLAAALTNELIHVAKTTGPTKSTSRSTPKRGPRTARIDERRVRPRFGTGSGDVRRGAAEPDIDEETDNPVYAVGVGPGNPNISPPAGERAIREADVVVGFTTVVEFVEDETDADLLTCGYKDEAEALEEFGERVAAGESGTAVAMGDPNHSGYQFVGKSAGCRGTEFHEPLTRRLVRMQSSAGIPTSRSA